jgi:DNA-binding NtrC family response regulator
MPGIVRPCFIVIDPEHSGSISTRKLVIETAKLNVITAYSGAEALQTVKKYPAVDGVVCNTEVRDIPLPNLICAIREVHPHIPVIAIGPEVVDLSGADYRVDSFDPRRLLDVLQTLEPDKVDAILQHERELHADEVRDAEEEAEGSD